MMFLNLASQVESQLRDAYARKYETGEITQSSLAEKLGVNRSVVHRRLMGHANMRIDTIADMVWALGQEIEVRIYEPDGHALSNFRICETLDSDQPSPVSAHGNQPPRSNFPQNIEKLLTPASSIS